MRTYLTQHALPLKFAIFLKASKWEHQNTERRVDDEITYEFGG